jgi:zinc protease
MMASLRVLGLALALSLGLVWALPADAVDIRKVAADGIEAWLVEDHSNPVIALRLAFRGGAALDPAGREGVAYMASALLDEGAGDLDAAAFQRRVEDLAADLRFDADRDAFGASLRTLGENRDEAFRLLQLALTQPRFDSDAVDRIRAQIKASLRREAEDPDIVVTRRLFAVMFPDHPYGRPVQGTAASLDTIGPPDLQAFVRDRLARDRLVVGVVGDITAAELQPLLAALAAALPAKAAAGNVADVAPAARGQTVVVDMPARQSALAFAQPGLARDDPDFYALTVVNQAFGGSGLTARLFEQVREKRGLAYSVYTQPLPLDHAALVLGRAGTGNERVAETVAVIRQAWADLAADGLAVAELADAKTYLTGSFPLRLTSSDRIAQLLVTMQLEHLGIDYLDRRNALIERVTLADANRVARRVFDPATLAFVVAGEPKGLAPSP